jgi:hypothetical protein
MDERGDAPSPIWTMKPGQTMDERQGFAALRDAQVLLHLDELASFRKCGGALGVEVTVGSCRSGAVLDPPHAASAGRERRIVRKCQPAKRSPAFDWSRAMPIMLEGSCRCGAVRFSVASHTPYPYQLCYCSICGKTAGGAGFAINIMGEQVSRHRSPRVRERWAGMGTDLARRKGRPRTGHSQRTSGEDATTTIPIT